MPEPAGHGAAPVVRRAEEAERLGHGAEELAYLLEADDTGGALALIERTVAPGFATPPQFHAHLGHDWLAYVLEGALRLELDGRIAELPRGSAAFMPRGSYFRWANPQATPARCLFLYAPGDFAAYFREVVYLTRRRAARVHDYDETLGDIQSAQDRHGIVRRPPRRLILEA